MALFDLPFAQANSPMRTGLCGRCPRCGQGKLFVSFLKLARACEHCGLDYSFADPADGPAFFVMSFTSFFSVGAMMLLRAATQMPDWLVLTITTSLIVGASLALLTPVKGWLVNSQYFYKAAEGVLAEPLSSAPCGCANCAQLGRKARASAARRRSRR